MEYLTKFPKTPSLTLAKLICKEKKKLKFTIEKVRSSIRWQRGVRTKTSRNSPNEFAEIWSSVNQTVEYEPITDFILSGVQKLGVLCDIHFPYHDKGALQVAVNRIIKEKCDAILLDGDTIDFYPISEYSTDPRRRGTLTKELLITKNFLKELRSKFKGKIFFKPGNHEFRLERYVIKNAPELYELECITLPELLGFNELQITHINSRSLIKVAKGNLNILHGHEFGKEPLLSPVNPARGLYLKAKANAIEGHYHRTSEHVETTLNSKMITCWSVGCLCLLRAEYRPYNNWNHGFAIINIDGGTYGVQNYRIENGKIY